MEKIQELQSDLAELESLLKTATRQGVINALTVNINMLNTKIVTQSKALAIEISEAAKAARLPATKPKIFKEKIVNYSYEQTNTEVKIYVSIPNIHMTTNKDVCCSFTTNSCQFHVKNLDNKEYLFRLKNLMHDIDPISSFWRVRIDMIVITCAKVMEQNWPQLLRPKNKSKPYGPLDAKLEPDKGDPMNALMAVMKKIYETGDDEMKRNINKSWSENMDNFKAGSM